jgi:hypothetical protein
VGICSTLATFQKLIIKALSGLSGRKALIYLDDTVKKVKLPLSLTN